MSVRSEGVQGVDGWLVGVRGTVVQVVEEGVTVRGKGVQGGGGVACVEDARFATGPAGWERVAGQWRELGRRRLFGAVGVPRPRPVWACDVGVAVQSVQSELSMQGVQEEQGGVQGVGVQGVRVRGTSVRGGCMHGSGVQGSGRQGVGEQCSGVQGVQDMQGVGVQGMREEQVGGHGAGVQGLSVRGGSVRGGCVHGSGVQGSGRQGAGEQGSGGLEDEGMQGVGEQGFQGEQVGVQGVGVQDEGVRGGCGMGSSQGGSRVAVLVQATRKRAGWAVAWGAAVGRGMLERRPGAQSREAPSQEYEVIENESLEVTENMEHGAGIFKKCCEWIKRACIIA